MASLPQRRVSRMRRCRSRWVAARRGKSPTGIDDCRAPYTRHERDGERAGRARQCGRAWARTPAGRCSAPTSKRRTCSPSGSKSRTGRRSRCGCCGRAPTRITSRRWKSRGPCTARSQEPRTHASTTMSTDWRSRIRFRPARRARASSSSTRRSGRRCSTSICSAARRWCRSRCSCIRTITRDRRRSRSGIRSRRSSTTTISTRCARRSSGCRAVRPTPSGAVQGDPLNVVFIGTMADIGAASIRRNYRRDLHESDRAQRVFGRAPDIVGRKQAQTGAPATWIRLWATPMQFEGKSVYVAQVGRPVGGRFASAERAMGAARRCRRGPELPVQDMMYSGGLEKLGFVTGVGEAPRRRQDRWRALPHRWPARGAVLRHASAQPVRRARCSTGCRSWSNVRPPQGKATMRANERHGIAAIAMRATRRARTSARRRRGMPCARRVRDDPPACRIRPTSSPATLRGRAGQARAIPRDLLRRAGSAAGDASRLPALRRGADPRRRRNPPAPASRVDLGPSKRRLVAALVAGIGFECFEKWLDPPGTAVAACASIRIRGVFVRVDALSVPPTMPARSATAIMALPPEPARRAWC